MTDTYVCVTEDQKKKRLPLLYWLYTPLREEGRGIIDS